MKSLNELLLETVRPSDFSADLYRAHLEGPNFFARDEVLRLLGLWPATESPQSICRVFCVLKHLKYSLRFHSNTLGDQMLADFEGALPVPANEMVRLHFIGFSCMVLAFDLYEQTLHAFIKEKNVELDAEYHQRILESYLFAIYHLGRSPNLDYEQLQTILVGVHDSLNAFYCRPLQKEEVSAARFNSTYEDIVQEWVQSSADVRSLSPAYALVRIVFNRLGLLAPAERIACASLLEAAAGHVLELGDVFSRSESLQNCGSH